MILDIHGRRPLKILSYEVSVKDRFASKERFLSSVLKAEA